MNTMHENELSFRDRWNFLLVNGEILTYFMRKFRCLRSMIDDFFIQFIVKKLVFS